MSNAAGSGGDFSESERRLNLPFTRRVYRGACHRGWTRGGDVFPTARKSLRLELLELLVVGAVVAILLR